MERDIETLECGPGQEPDRRMVAVILKRDQLLYDIENNCYVEGHIIEEGGHDGIPHVVQDVGQEGNVDRVTRVLDIAHADIVERLYPFTQHGIRHPVVDDRLREKAAYGIFLSVHGTFSQTTLNLLGKLIHELLVCIATADWLSITHTPKEEVWRRKAEAVINRINEIRNFRHRRIRIKPHWL